MYFHDNKRISSIVSSRVVWLNINGFGPSRIKDFESYCCGSEKALERLSQASSMPQCYLVCACVNDCPIGYCSIVFLDKEFESVVNFAIDFVYIDELYRGKGYSRIIAAEVVRVIDEYAAIDGSYHLVDMSNIISDEGEIFSSTRTNELRDLGYCVTFGGC